MPSGLTRRSSSALRSLNRCSFSLVTTSSTGARWAGSSHAASAAAYCILMMLEGGEGGTPSISRSEVARLASWRGSYSPGGQRADDRLESLSLEVDRSESSKVSSGLVADAVPPGLWVCTMCWSCWMVWSRSSRARWSVLRRSAPPKSGSAACLVQPPSSLKSPVSAARKSFSGWSPVSARSRRAGRPRTDAAGCARWDRLGRCRGRRAWRSRSRTGA